MNTEQISISMYIYQFCSVLTYVCVTVLFFRLFVVCLFATCLHLLYVKIIALFTLNCLNILGLSSWVLQFVWSLAPVNNSLNLSIIYIVFCTGNVENIFMGGNMKKSNKNNNKHNKCGKKQECEKKTTRYWNSKS